MTKNNLQSGVKHNQSSLQFGASIFLTVLVNVFIVAIAFDTPEICINLGDNSVDKRGSMKRSIRLLWALISVALAFLLAGVAYLLASFAVGSGFILAYASAFVALVGSIMFILIAPKPWKDSK